MRHTWIIVFLPTQRNSKARGRNYSRKCHRFESVAIFSLAWLDYSFCSLIFTRVLSSSGIYAQNSTFQNTKIVSIYHKIDSNSWFDCNQEWEKSFHDTTGNIRIDPDHPITSSQSAHVFIYWTGYWIDRQKRFKLYWISQKLSQLRCYLMCNNNTICIPFIYEIHIHFHPAPREARVKHAWSIREMADIYMAFLNILRVHSTLSIFIYNISN